MPDTSGVRTAFTKGRSIGMDGISTFLVGQLLTISQVDAYMTGNGRSTTRIPAFLEGHSSNLSPLPAFVQGRVLVRSSQSAFIGTPIGAIRSSLRARFGGDGGGAVMRSSIHANIAEGVTMEVSYIEFKTSDAGVTKSAKFRVIAQGYDDGLPEKAENIERTIGGGIDYSSGAVYLSWNPMIRVRHTESETGYGTLADLLYFYELNNPNGTPSNKITFIDHHQTEYTVFMVGAFRKGLMGCKVEGGEAWYTVQVQLVRIPV